MNDHPDYDWLEDTTGIFVALLLSPFVLLFIAFLLIWERSPFGKRQDEIPYD